MLYQFKNIFQKVTNLANKKRIFRIYAGNIAGIKNVEKYSVRKNTIKCPEDAVARTW